MLCIVVQCVVVCTEIGNRMMKKWKNVMKSHRITKNLVSIDNNIKSSVITLRGVTTAHLFNELVDDDSWECRIFRKFFNFCVNASTTFKCVKISTTATVFVEENSGSIVASSSACIVISFWLRNAFKPVSSKDSSCAKLWSLTKHSSASLPDNSSESRLLEDKPFSEQLISTNDIKYTI